MTDDGVAAALRVAFLGNAPWSVAPLEALARSRHPVVLVATRAPKPAGRGARLTPTPVAKAARALGLSLLETATIKRGEGLERLRACEPDVLAVVAYGEILPPKVLDLSRVAPVNLHFSLLPALRGAAPVQRAILRGHERTGVTTMRIDEGLDTGPILLQRETEIRANEDAGSLGERLARGGSELLVETLDGLLDGTIEPREQDERLATYAPKIDREEERIDWTRPAEEVLRLVRALGPSPGAWTTFRGERLKVLEARGVGGAPGWTSYEPTPRIVHVGPRGEPIVLAGDLGQVRLDVVAPAGRRRMSGAAFVRGYRPARDDFGA